MRDELAVFAYYIYYKYLQRFSSRAKLERYQARKRKRQLEYLATHAALYRNVKNWEDVPPMDKTIMMEHFNALNTVGLDRDEALAFALQAEKERNFSPKLHGVTVGLSSGTSGSRGIFLVSDRERRQWAGYILAKFLPGSILKKHTIGFFMRADSNLYETVQSKRIRFCFFDIYQDLDTYQQQLAALNPDLLVGQPSILLMLAQAQQEKKLQLSPKRVISIAEVLEKEDAARICQAFQVPVVHQVYQCTEGCLATTCEHGVLHLNENVVFFEKEDLGDGRFVPIISDMERRAQPIIRYRMNDILVEKQDGCACGSPFCAIDRIEGREDDVFVFAATGGGETKVFADFIRRCILFAGDLPDYRVVQHKDGSISVYSDVSEAQKAHIVKEFAALAADKHFLLPEISFYPYAVTRGKKMKRVERERA